MAGCTVAVVAFDGINPFLLSVPCAVFGRMPGFNLQVCAAEPGTLRSDAGFDIVCARGLAGLARAELIVVPGWRDPAEVPPPALLAALRRAHARGAQIVGLCLGAFVLAHAGLLDGRRASTHWHSTADFAARFPQVALDADVLYVGDGPITTSAGAAAALDCCLHLVRQRSGHAAAVATARMLVTPPHRVGGQAQYVPQTLPGHARGAAMSELLDWLRAHLHEPLPLDTLAARVHMSRRSFTRHFQAQTGLSVGAWLRGERLRRCQQLLEASDHSIEAIAALTGLGSAPQLRSQFKAAFGVSPRTWRQQFRPL